MSIARKLFEDKLIEFLKIVESPQTSPTEDMSFIDFLLKAYKLSRAIGSENLQQEMRKLEDDYAVTLEKSFAKDAVN